VTIRDEDALVEQLHSLRDTPLREGFEAMLSDRLAEVSRERHLAPVVPITRSPRRKLVGLLAAMTLPLAAAAATGAIRALTQQQAEPVPP